jgi:hypothetical protein
MARLYLTLGTVLWLRGQTTGEERVSLGRAGVALLGDDSACAEAALMIYLSAGWSDETNQLDGEARELVLRAGELAERLPYPEAWAWTDGQKDFSDLIGHVASANLYIANLAEHLRLARYLQDLAARHDDVMLGGIGTALLVNNLWAIGDVHAALDAARQARALFADTDTFNEQYVLRCLSAISLTLGDLDGAEESARAGLALLPDTPTPWTGILLYDMVQVALCRGAWAEAMAHLQEAVNSFRTVGFLVAEIWVLVALGHVALAGDDPAGAARYIEEAQRLMEARPYDLNMDFPLEGMAWAAGILEAAGRPVVAWEGLERIARAQTVGGLSPLLLTAQPAAPHTFGHVEHISVGAPPGSEWIWQDPFGDCAYSVVEGATLEFQAAHAHHLMGYNVSAPRMVRPAPPGDYAVETVSRPARADRPAIGGLLLWADHDNFLVLERGALGPSQVWLRGRLAGRDIVVGRGSWRGDALWLRLERQDTRVRALCSADGQAWVTVGAVEFPHTVGQHVGLHAIGLQERGIDRTIYPGAQPEGTAIRFASFDLWTAKEQ